MKTYTITTLITVVLLTATLVAPAWSMDDHTISLTATDKHPHASGSTFINSNSINVQARGLNANSVYTVWFVNMKPKKHETGAGTSPYMFKTDAFGNGNYSAPLAASPFGRWQMIMVVLHPDGNPENMKKMVGALKAEIKS